MPKAKKIVLSTHHWDKRLRPDGRTWFVRLPVVRPKEGHTFVTASGYIAQSGDDTWFNTRSDCRTAVRKLYANNPGKYIGGLH